MLIILLGNVLTEGANHQYLTAYVGLCLCASENQAWVCNCYKPLVLNNCCPAQWGRFCFACPAGFSSLCDFFSFYPKIRKGAPSHRSATDHCRTVLEKVPLIRSLNPKKNWPFSQKSLVTSFSCEVYSANNTKKHTAIYQEFTDQPFNNKAEHDERDSVPFVTFT